MASVPFEFDCVKEAGFVMDPNAHPRFGYITALDGFGLGPGSALSADLNVSVPFNVSSTYPPLELKPAPLAAPAAPIPTATVVGVIEKFTWAGGVGDAIHLEFWCSQENSLHVKALQQLALKNTAINALGWWIADYDPETKLWFEQSYPQSPTTIAGTVPGGDNPMMLDVDLTGAPVKDGIDVLVYKVSISVVPAANRAYSLMFANSSNKPVVKAWGLEVGSLASSADPI